MRTTRRSIFKMGVGSLFLGPIQTRPGQKGSTHSSFDPWIEIYADNLRHNLSEIARRVSSRPIMAVIKNNGYGLGVENVARILEPLQPVWGFAVVKAHEAHSLRDAGIRKPILLLGPFDEKNLEDAVARDIRPMVYTPIGAALDRISAKLQKKIPLHICIDTGIGRVGVPFRDAGSLVRDLARLNSVIIEGTMMTFTEDPAFDKEQLRRFTELGRTLESAGIQLGKKHSASSYALFQNPDSFLDMVRPGMAIFGIYSEKDFRKTGILDLRPALSLKARVAYIKKLAKGDSAGYNRAFKAEKDTWVATLPSGHADGLPRTAVEGARVRIGNSLYPIIGTVSASHSIIEIGSQPSVKIGDIATFYDYNEGSRPEDFADGSNASVYDLTMHLNALLPRNLL